MSNTTNPIDAILAKLQSVTDIVNYVTTDYDYYLGDANKASYIDKLPEYLFQIACDRAIDELIGDDNFGCYADTFSLVMQIGTKLREVYPAMSFGTDNFCMIWVTPWTMESHDLAITAAHRAIVQIESDEYWVENTNRNVEILKELIQKIRDAGVDQDTLDSCLEDLCRNNGDLGKALGFDITG